MIDAVSTPGAAKLAIESLAKGSVGLEGGDDAFSRLVRGLAQCLAQPGSSPEPQLLSVASTISQVALADGDILAGLLSIGPDEAVEAGLVEVSQGETGEQDESSAIEAMLALLTAAAAQLQPWQIKPSANNTLDSARGSEGASNGQLMAGEPPGRGTACRAPCASS